MPKFPKRQADIEALLNTMFYGYLAHMADFPSADVGALSMAYITYYSAKLIQTQALAAAQVATEQKNATLHNFKRTIKSCLKKSAVDVADDPAKLAYIGWGPKAIAELAVKPSQPRNLTSDEQAEGIVRLKWNRAANGGLIILKSWWEFTRAAVALTNSGTSIIYCHITKC